MLELFIDLLVVRMKHKPVPTQMLNQVFALTCDLDCEWNSKNKNQPSEEKHWEDLFGAGEIFARSPGNFNQVRKIHLCQRNTNMTSFLVKGPIWMASRSSESFWGKKWIRDDSRFI